MIQVQKWLGKETTIKRKIVEGKMVVVSVPQVYIFTCCFECMSIKLHKLLCSLN